MAKRTKISKFRELYDVIDDLLCTYTYEGAVEILSESYDLTLTPGTLNNYVYRYKKQLNELSVATDNSSSETETETEQGNTKQGLSDSKSSELIKEQAAGVSAVLDPDAALARFKLRQQRKSLFD